MTREVLEEEPTTGFQHATDFPDGGRVVTDVVEDVQLVGEVKRSEGLPSDPRTEGQTFSPERAVHEGQEPGEQVPAGEMARERPGERLPPLPGVAAGEVARRQSTTPSVTAAAGPQCFIPDP